VVLFADSFGLRLRHSLSLRSRVLQFRVDGLDALVELLHALFDLGLLLFARRVEVLRQFGDASHGFGLGFVGLCSQLAAKFVDLRGGGVDLFLYLRHRVMKGPFIGLEIRSQFVRQMLGFGNHAMLLRIAIRQLAGQYLMPTRVSPNWPWMRYFETVMMPDVG